MVANTEVHILFSRGVHKSYKETRCAKWSHSLNLKKDLLQHFLEKVPLDLRIRKFRPPFVVIFNNPIGLSVCPIVFSGRPIGLSGCPIGLSGGNENNATSDRLKETIPTNSFSDGKPCIFSSDSHRP